MIIYIVSMSTTQGPYGPTVNMTYHRDHQDALDEFTECTKSLSEDPSTILLVKVDGETMTETMKAGKPSSTIITRLRVPISMTEAMPTEN